MTPRGRDLAAGWHRFWFAPVDTSTLGVLRIVTGLVVFGWTLSLAPDLSAFFGPHGILPRTPQPAWTFSLLGTSPSMTLVVALYCLLLVGSLCLAAGLGTRVAAVVVWLLLLSFDRRNALILNAGDDLLRLDAFYLMLAPAGAALSVDRWLRHRDRFWEFPQRAPWAVRLIQIQLSAMYLFAVWAKVRGTDWNDGTAVSYALRVGDLTRFPAPHFLTDNLTVVNLLTYGTLALEISLALLVWNRRLRPWLLLAGIAMHLSIEFGILVGFFSIAVIASYVAWVSPEAMTRVLLGARQRLRRGRPVKIPATVLPLPQPAERPRHAASRSLH